MAYLYSGILLINKTVWTTNTLNNVGESHKYYAKGNKAPKHAWCMFHSCELVKKAKLSLIMEIEH